MLHAKKDALPVCVIGNMKTELYYKIYNKSTNKWYSFKDYFKAEKMKQKFQSYGCKVDLLIFEKKIKEKISPGQISLI